MQVKFMRITVERICAVMASCWKKDCNCGSATFLVWHVVFVSFNAQRIAAKSTTLWKLLINFSFSPDDYVYLWQGALLQIDIIFSRCFQLLCLFRLCLLTFLVIFNHIFLRTFTETADAVSLILNCHFSQPLPSFFYCFWHEEQKRKRKEIC